MRDYLVREPPYLYFLSFVLDLIERVDKVNMIQKYIVPLTQPNNKIQTEANSNTKLKEAL